MQKHITAPLKTHEHAINRLALQTDRPIDEVAAVYDREVAELDSKARVKNFVPVIAYRQARDALKRH